MGRNKRHKTRRNHSRVHNHKPRRVAPGQLDERARFVDNDHTNLEVIEHRPVDERHSSRSPDRKQVEIRKESSVTSSKSGTPDSKQESNIEGESESIKSCESIDNLTSSSDAKQVPSGTVASYNISLNDCDVYNSQPIAQPAIGCSCINNNQASSSRQPPAVIVVEPKHDESMQCDCTKCQFFSGWCCMPCLLFTIIAVIIIWWCASNKTVFTGSGSGGNDYDGTTESGQRFDDIGEQHPTGALESFQS